MFTIDEIRIEGDEDGFHLIIYTDEEIGWHVDTIRKALALLPATQAQADALYSLRLLGTEPQRFRIGLPDQFRVEVERTIGAWLGEREAVRLEGVSWERLPEGAGIPPGYEITDPKHPDHRDTMSGIHDNRGGK